jgi:ABC-type sugar transport system ATPase subunit
MAAAGGAFLALPGMNTIIECAGLGKRYRQAWALRDCTLGIPSGRVVALSGRTARARPPCST